MANTSAQLMMQTLTDIVEYGNDTGSVNLYMAHGGTNFGYWAGTLHPPHTHPLKPKILMFQLESDVNVIPCLQIFLSNLTSSFFMQID